MWVLTGDKQETAITIGTVEVWPSIWEGVANTIQGVSITIEGVANTIEGVAITIEGVANTAEGIAVTILCYDKAR